MKKFFIGFLSIVFLVLVSKNISGLGYGIPKGKDHKPPYPGKQVDEMIRNNGGYYIGDTSKKEIYLTFDNGYENGYTNDILDVLKKHNVPAIFFITGHYVKSAPEYVERMVEDGHLVGNHSYYHYDYTKLSEEKMKEDIEMLNTRYMDLIGSPMSTFFRPPAGTFNQQSLSYVNSLGYTNLFWSLAYKDWEVKNQKGADYAYKAIMNYIHPGAIILLHSVSRDNAEALERIIVDLQKEGYTFKSVNNLLSAN